MYNSPSGAIISEDGRFRYALWRRWDQDQLSLTWEGAPALWVGLNPSTADASIDDPTVRRIAGFSRRWGAPGFLLVNLFGLRSTDPDHLRDAADPIGPDNDRIIGEAAALCGQIVLCWGAHPVAVRGWRRSHVFDILRASGRNRYTLGTTTAGHPKHPLYLATTTEREPYPRIGD